MVTLRPVKKEEKDLFWNINQKYLYEMTNFYPDDMDEEGNLHYGHFEEYFVDEKRRAFFILNDEKKVGFVMINPYSNIGHNPDYTMAEFTIFPAYRRNHFAKEAVDLIFKEFSGNWEIKYNEKNIPAKTLWTNITKKYNPKVYHLNEYETVLEFSNGGKL